MGKTVFFWAVLILTPFLVLEAAVRAYFATQVGPSVLLYGTPATRRLVTPQWADRATPTDKHEAKDYSQSELIADSAVTTHENELEGYSKYFPNQVRYDFDVETGERFPVGINNRGFRGADFDEQKAPGVVRVATLGASSTFGFYARDDETYPHYLEGILNERCTGGPRFEVINLGIPHLLASDIYNLFMAEGLPLEPDLVTFYEGNNDADLVVREVTSRTPLRIWLGRAGAILITARLVDSLLGNPFHKSLEPRVVEEHAQRVSRDFIASVEQLHEATTDYDIPFVVISQQRNSQSVDRMSLRGLTHAEELAQVGARLADGERMTEQEIAFLSHARIMHDLEDWATSNQVPFVDALSALDLNRDVLTSWVHLTAAGNRMVAEALADGILNVISEGDGSGSNAFGCFNAPVGSE